MRVRSDFPVLAVTGLMLLLGCGGRSDSDAFGSVANDSSIAGSAMAGNGGNSYHLPSTGTALGSGGAAMATNGGSGFLAAPYPCCSSHPEAACSEYAAIDCVCTQHGMAECCTKSWSEACVAMVKKGGCVNSVTCPSVASGGAPSLLTLPGSGGSTYTSTNTLGGTSSYGGSLSLGGSSYSGGSTSRGGSNSGGTSNSGGSTSRGGSNSGGSNLGGSSYFGGSTSRGGSNSGGTIYKLPCCMSHPGTGCDDPKIERCVCTNDAVCCSTGWDDVCVRQVNDFCSSMLVCAVGGAGGTGGSGGTPAQGGTSSMGGNTTGNGGSYAAGGAPAATISMIDDLEDGDGIIISTEGRQGYWYTFNDGTVNSIQLPPLAPGRVFINPQLTDDRPSSKYAAWTEGSGFTNWGAAMGVYLNGSSGFYDAGKYRGITFWAKSESGRSSVMRVSLSDNQTLPSGNICVGDKCYDHFGVTISGLSTSWQRYSYLWTDLRQAGWGDPLVSQINYKSLRDIEFTFEANVDFGVYIDDLAFIL